VVDDWVPTAAGQAPPNWINHVWTEYKTTLQLAVTRWMPFQEHCESGKPPTREFLEARVEVSQMLYPNRTDTVESVLKIKYGPELKMKRVLNEAADAVPAAGNVEEAIRHVTGQ
jgi:hypothetical protein